MKMSNGKPLMKISPDISLSSFFLHEKLSRNKKSITDWVMLDDDGSNESGVYGSGSSRRRKVEPNQGDRLH